MYSVIVSKYSETIYNEWKIAPDSANYNIIVDQEMLGNVNIQQLKHALGKFISDHLLFNSYINCYDDQLYWVPNTEVLQLEYFDQNISLTVIAKCINTRFNLEQGPLYRFLIFQITPCSYRLIMVFHKILSSAPFFENDILKAIVNYYNNPNYKPKYTIDEQLKLITQLNKNLNQTLHKNIPESRKFWLINLDNLEEVDLKFLQVGELISSKYNIQEENKSVAKLKFEFTNNEYAQLKAVIDIYEINELEFSQAILAYILSRYTGQSEFGISCAVRIKEIDDFIYGTSVNLNVMPYRFSQINCLNDLFLQVKDFKKSLITDNFNNSYCPIDEIIGASNINLLKVGFVQAKLEALQLNFAGISDIFIKDEFNTGIQNDLLFEQEIINGKILCVVKYDSFKIDSSLLLQFVENYKRLFKEILSDMESGDIAKRLSEYRLLNEEDYLQIVDKWNHTARSYPEQTIHELFEEQVVRTPNNIAIVYENTQLTYQELDKKANQLAHYLNQHYQIKPDELIALYLDRSEYMLIAILAILKSGGAYVPIDLSYPDDRINYILENTKAKLVLINGIYEKRIAKIIFENAHTLTTRSLLIDNSLFQEQLNKESMIGLKTKVTVNNLVYVMYTSGTTGKPKGVMLPHSGCAIRVLEMIKSNEMSESDTLLFKTNYIFDVSFSDIFSTLLSGAKLYVTKDTFNLTELKYIFENVKINICHFVPSQFPIISREIDFTKHSHLTRIMFSGEALNDNILKCLSSVDKTILNYYGPTESGEVTLQKFSSYDITNKINNNLIIGKQFPYTSIYICDKELNPLPVGVVGELYIGGAGVARGYLNMPELTLEKFMANPFQTPREKAGGENTQLYKTGDLARQLPDGKLEYVGRNDFQVKIRGYRIELGEIESCLSSYSGIKQVVVTVCNHIDNNDNSANKYLVAYYVAENKLDEKLLFSYLRNRLSDHMVPNFIIYLEQLPITLNGKLARNLLPVATFSKIQYIAPRYDLEIQLCKLYADILSINSTRISIQDDFFKLGGNNILAIKLVRRINTKFNIQLTVLDIIENRTLEMLALEISQTSNTYQAVTKLNTTDDKPNLFIIHPEMSGYNVSINLANKILTSFSCYGITNYNLHHENKIQQLNELAEYYLGHIEQVLLHSEYKDYYLLGWSFAGQVALKIAYLLEQKGIKNIKVYLFDTFLNNQQFYLSEYAGEKSYTKALTVQFENYGFKQEYIGKLSDATQYDICLMQSGLSGRLKYTQVGLYKALMSYAHVDMKGNAGTQLPFNNIDLYVNKSNLFLIYMKNSTHFNILEHIDFIHL